MASLGEIIAILAAREKAGQYRPPEGDMPRPGLPGRPVREDEVNPADLYGYYKWDPEFNVGLPNAISPSVWHEDEQPEGEDEVRAKLFDAIAPAWEKIKGSKIWQPPAGWER